MTDDDAKRLAEIRRTSGQPYWRSVDDFNFLLRLLDEALAAREWRAVDDKTPRNKLIWTWWPAYKDRQPTYWMPLPEQPK